MLSTACGISGSQLETASCVCCEKVAQTKARTVTNQEMPMTLNGTRTKRIDTRRHTVPTHTGCWQSPLCVPPGCERDTEGRAQCAYPVVNRDKRRMPCRRLSPLSPLPPLFSPFAHFRLFSTETYALILLLTGSFFSSNPNPTRAAC